MQLALVLRAVTVRVTHKRRLVVVMEQRIADSDKIAAVGDVEQAVIVVLVVLKVRRQIAVIDPDVARSLDGDGVTLARKHLGDLEVTQDDIATALDSNTNASQG